ncbi:cytochrome b [Bailinhaonella thermotolerans]|uniref:cytochrome bc1 complex cytochrome b subunit n=1 Tax=Bailinhaonella thermotolerans TaxID=1070861 RepID=UPI00192A2FC8|nr:cytochrome bc complex cytochrome b subunit [Bailinhaonella thermotolerans]
MRAVNAAVGGASARAGRGTAGRLDDRLGMSRALRPQLRKLFPDHWSFLLGEIALYSFAVLVLTGTFLTFFYRPSMDVVVHQGAYPQLRGLAMPEAYDSVLRLSLEVRGGLLMRQIHHWAAVFFVLAIFSHLMRVFFTGAFRRPRELSWLTGIALLALALVESFLGYSLPLDQVSGAGLRMVDGLLLAVPVVGTYLSLFLFGGEFPGDVVIPRLFTGHVLLVPGLLAALVPLHALALVWVQKHSEFPLRGRSEDQVVGGPFYPFFIAKTAAFFLFTFGVIALFGAFGSVNPVWLYGPYTPAAASQETQPDWYFGFLDGALRLMPGWDVNVLGHTLSLGPLVPMLVLGLLFALLTFYPFIERRFTGGRDWHHLLQYPSDAPVRTAIGVAYVTFFAVLWLASGAGSLHHRLAIPPEPLIWALRAALLLAPALAYGVTLSLARRRRHRRNSPG